MARNWTFPITLTLLLSSFGFGLAATGWKPVGNVSKVAKIAHGLELTAGTARVQVVALSDSVVRVRFSPGGEFSQHASFAVVEDTELSAPSIQVTDTAAAVELRTKEISIRIHKSPLRIVFLNANGEEILKDHPDYPVSFNGSAFRVWKAMPEDEHYYGLGDKAGAMDHRNQSFTMWNTDAFGWAESTDPLYKSIPFFMGMRNGKSYGLFLDNTYRTNFDFGKESRDFFSFGADGGDFDYYFFYGPDPKKVIRDYTALTGRTPLPPLFSLGYQQCRYSYYPEARVREVANEFRSRKIPADVIYLDIDYQHGNRPFTVDRNQFPNFEGMIKDLGQQGFKVVAITDLHLKKESGYKPYDEGEAGGFFVKNPDGSDYIGKVWPGDSVFPDFTRREVRQWWGTLYKDFTAMGIRGFWNDMNEPAIFERADKTMPLDTVHRVEDRKTDHREIHNVFGMQNARATYEGLLKLQPDQRPFVLTRAAYAGTQRYAASWTGDNSSTWNHMRMTLPTLLSLGISGYPFVGVDIGGFNGTPTAELLTRWMELGAFNPVYRNHTMKGSADQEPWVHGPEHEAIRRRYIEARYRLLPYIYTNMEESTRTGVPLMRPMFMEFPHDPALTTNDSEFMFGDKLLVAPKTVETLEAYEVRLPQGTWYDYWTGEKIAGGKGIFVNPALDAMPVYVRGGSVIPQQPVAQNTDEIPQGPLTLRVYPDPGCQGSLYSDDGNTFAYQRGTYLAISFTCEPAAGSLRILGKKMAGTFPPWWQSMEVNVIGVDTKPEAVLVAGQPMDAWKYDATTKSVVVPVTDATLPLDVTLRFALR